MHCALTFKLLNTAATTITANLNKEQRFVLRNLIIGMILATDLARHFELLGKFRGLIAEREHMNDEEDK
jgi:hypothetical protein